MVNKQDRIHIFHCLYQHYLTQTHARFSILLVDSTVSIEFYLLIDEQIQLKTQTVSVCVPEGHNIYTHFECIFLTSMHTSMYIYYKYIYLYKYTFCAPYRRNKNICSFSNMMNILFFGFIHRNMTDKEHLQTLRRVTVRVGVCVCV